MPYLIFSGIHVDTRVNRSNVLRCYNRISRIGEVSIMKSGLCCTSTIKWDVFPLFIIWLPSGTDLSCATKESTLGVTQRGYVGMSRRVEPVEGTIFISECCMRGNSVVYSTPLRGSLGSRFLLSPVHCPR